MDLKLIYRNAVNVLLTKYNFQKISNVFLGELEEYNKGKKLYSYRIEINLKPILYNQLPKIHEVGGQIPRIPDFHINSDGSFCFGYSITNKIIFAENLANFSIFIEKNVKSFLAAVKVKEITGKWGAKEYNHHSEIAENEEIFECFSLTSKDKNYLSNFLNVLFSQKGKCYCGSNRLYKSCHKNSNERILKYINKMEVKKIIDDMFK